MTESPYRGTTNRPVEFALKRAEFEQEKLRQLIALADQANFATAKMKKASWQRMLAKAQAAQAHFQRIEKEGDDVPERFYIKASLK